MTVTNPNIARQCVAAAIESGAAAHERKETIQSLNVADSTLNQGITIVANILMPLKEVIAKVPNEVAVERNLVNRYLELAQGLSVMKNDLATIKNSWVSRIETCPIQDVAIVAWQPTIHYQSLQEVFIENLQPKSQEFSDEVFDLMKQFTVKTEA